MNLDNQPLTGDHILDDTNYFYLDNVRSAVMWVIQELELLETISEEDYVKYDERASGGEALAFGVAIDKIKTWFPVFFDEEGLEA